VQTVDLPIWSFYVPGVVIVLAGAGILRWLLALQRRTSDHAERISRIEGRLNGRPHNREDT
jgi:hypothetical protein